MRWNGRKGESGAAYISVIVIVALLFIWITFQLERLIQNQQTVHFDTGIIQAQHLAESGIEKMRSQLRNETDYDESVTVQLGTGEAEAQLISRNPLRVRSIGRVEPDIQQTITVELDPDTLQIVTWSRQTQ